MKFKKLGAPTKKIHTIIVTLSNSWYRCSSDECDILDGCHCSGSEPPVDIDKRPQIVYMTFDDAFTAQAESQFYRSLFDGTYTNPNGCAIRATHFITQVNSINIWKSFTTGRSIERLWLYNLLGMLSDVKVPESGTLMIMLFWVSSRVSSFRESQRESEGVREIQRESEGVREIQRDS